MSEIRYPFVLYGKPPLSQFLVSLVIVISVGVLLFTLMMLAGTVIFKVDLDSFAGATLAEAGEKNLGFLRYLMVIQDLCLFIVPSIIIMLLMKPPSGKRMSDMHTPDFTEIILVITLAVCIFPVTGFAGQLNEGMHLPHWLSGVEKWMTEKEKTADSTINLLITARTFGVVMFNLFMIAILPAIGEEFIFRGVFQKIFYGLFRSPHIAIWITAIIFSALHFQFFGFIPRFILGLVFGYLFFWSGTLWIPVLAHFINNAVPVIMIFIVGSEKDAVLTSDPLWKELFALAVPVIICTVILIHFRNRFVLKKLNSTPENESSSTSQ